MLSGGQENQDAEILTLFRQWIAEHRGAEQISKAIEAEDEYNVAISQICEIEHEIADTPATGLIGFSVKAYLACHYEHWPMYGDDPAGVSLLSYGFLIEVEPSLDNYVNFHCIAAVIRDAARFVPEIAELAGPVIALSPEQVAEETARVRAEILGVDRPAKLSLIEIVEPELTAVHERRKACPNDPSGEALWEKLCVELDRLEDLICTTPPATIADCAVKLRLLRHPELGIEARDFFDIHATALDQICEFIERSLKVPT